MTWAELDRYFESYQRKRRNEERRKASYDYILADLIGRSNARVHSSKNKLPAIYEAYPNLFSKEEIEQKAEEKRIATFAAKLKQFATTHNAKINEEAKEK